MAKSVQPVPSQVDDEALAQLGQFKNRIIGLEYIDRSEIQEHPKNWRVHTSEQREALGAVLDKVGVAGASLGYRSPKYGGRVTLIDGHMRRGMYPTQPVIMLDVSDDEADVLIASFDRITTMAQTDEAKLGKLLTEIQEAQPDLATLMRLLGSERAKTESWLEEEAKKASKDGIERPEYPIEPILDESYDYVLIFSRSDSEWSSLMTRLQLPVRQSKKAIAESHVLSVADFIKQWDAHTGVTKYEAEEDRINNARKAGKSND